MTIPSAAPLLNYLRQARGDAPDRCPGDAGLLDLFARTGDQAAFAILLQRHGPMVFGVCRRVLRDRHDAEDAFQATFLLLVRKARSIRRPDLLGPWLYGVAHRTALKAKSVAFRRGIGEPNFNEIPAPPSDDVVWRDLRPVLDDAIDSLPAKYRAPFVLCYLQGLTNAQAGRRLGCPEGTVATRLSRARQRLRGRLARHGLGVAAGAFAVGVWANAASAALPPLLLVSTLRIATVLRAGKVLRAAEIPVKVAALTEGVCKAMYLTKLRFALATTALVAATIVGVTTWTMGAVGSEPPTEQRQAPQAVVPPVATPVPPTPIPPAGYQEPAFVVRTDNFEVSAPSRRVAQIIADAAERSRKSEATRWLGKELPRWATRCKVHVKTGEDVIGSATAFGTEDGKVTSRDMNLQGPLDKLLASSIPHEITHTIFADHIGSLSPRWADEGAALMAEEDEEQSRHDAVLQQILGEKGGFIPLTELLPLADYPKNVMALYAEGFSLTRFLVERKDRKTFLDFVKHAMTNKSWDEAAGKYYDFENVDKLQEAWLAKVKLEAKDRPTSANTPRTMSGTAPTFGSARIGADGKIYLKSIVASYERVTRYHTSSNKEGVTIATPTTTYEMLVGENVIPLEEWNYEAVDSKGKAVDKNDLRKRLAEETPVLIAFNSKKVDPYYLQIIKEDTLIILATVKVSEAPPAK
jgi:RNA polymerase sigma factor (sigma-70 family)